MACKIQKKNKNKKLRMLQGVQVRRLGGRPCLTTRILNLYGRCITTTETTKRVLAKSLKRILTTRINKKEREEKKYSVLFCLMRVWTFEHLSL
jgi:hypothetical protein